MFIGGQKVLKTKQTCILYHNINISYSQNMKSAAPALNSTKNSQRTNKTSKPKLSQTYSSQKEASSKKSPETGKVLIRKSTRGRIQEKEWSCQQEKKLYQLHESMGNRWTNIAKHFKDRTDNDIKNHLFSRFRLSIRRINKIISGTTGVKLKLLKASIILKIISTCELRFNNQHHISSIILNLAIKLKNDLLTFLYEHHSDKMSDQVKLLVKQLHYFNEILNSRKRKQSYDNSIDNCTQEPVQSSHLKSALTNFPAVSKASQGFEQEEDKDYFVQLISQQICPVQSDKQSMLDQSQLLRSPIHLGDGPFSLQRLPEILPPFFIEQAYEYCSGQGYVCHQFEAINPSL